MDDKAAYRALCEDDTSLPLFLQAWWLDATCGDNGWNVALVRNGGGIQAALPYQIKRVRGFTVVSQPALTQFLGPWLSRSEAKKANDYGRQKDLMSALIAALPSYDHYVQNWSPGITNWLPFYWNGFSQSTNYTYILRDLGDEALLWTQLRDNIRKEIRKAQSRFSITVAEGDLETFQRLNTMTFARQGKTPPYSNAYLERLDAACASRGRRRILIARDKDGGVHAGAYIVWDTNSAYYLIGGSDPALRNSGAMSLCLWEAIRFAAGVTKAFDFEGSMIEPIERFFRAFGAEQTPYFRVTRTPSRVLRGAIMARSLLGAR